MDLSHRKAFELIQRSLDGRLDAGERAELERHLATCAQCQTDAALYRRLEQEARLHYPATMPSQKEIQQTIRKTQAHHRRRRMFKRLSSPVRAVALVGVAAAFVLAVIWIFNTLPRQPQTGTSVGEATEVIKVEKETVVETVIVTATPQVFDIEAEREAVLAEYDAQVDAMAAADWAAVLEYTHKDASFFYTYSDIQGDNTRSGIDLDRPSMLWHATDQDVIVTPELAVVKSLVTMQIPPGPEAKVYHTAVYKKEDGQWYMIHSHESWRP